MKALFSQALVSKVSTIQSYPYMSTSRETESGRDTHWVLLLLNSNINCMHRYRLLFGNLGSNPHLSRCFPPVKSTPTPKEPQRVQPALRVHDAVKPTTCALHTVCECCSTHSGSGIECHRVSPAASGVTPAVVHSPFAHSTTTTSTPRRTYLNPFHLQTMYYSLIKNTPGAEP